MAKPPKTQEPEKPEKKASSSTAAVEKLLRRRADGIKKRENFRSLMSDIEDFSAPDRACWVGGAEGQKRNKTFDSTAINSRTSFANRMQSDMMPPFQRWLVLKPSEFVPKDKRAEMQKALDDANNKFHAVIQASNFDTAINEFLQDLAAGTAIFMPEEDEDDSPMNFYAIPPAQAWIEEGARGKITANGRDYKIKASQIMDTWHDATLTDDMEQSINSRSANKEEMEYTLFEICHKLPGARRWAYQVIDEKSKKIIVDRMYDSNRFIPVRWSKMSGETWGRGPLVNALPDIKTLNKLVELLLRHAALRIAGVWAAAHDNVINPNNVVITPGAVIPVARTGGPNGASLQDISPKGDIQVAELERENLTMNIKKMMFDKALPPDAGPVRSATEIIERIKELLKDIGAPFGRLMSELVQPLAQSVLDMLYRRGQIKERILVNGILVKAQIISPLAQVQSITDVENIVRWMQILASFGNETLYIAAKIEDIGEYIGELLGIPSELRRDKEERANLQKTVAQLLAAKPQQVPAGEGISQGNVIPVA